MIKVTRMIKSTVSQNDSNRLFVSSNNNKASGKKNQRDKPNRSTHLETHNNTTMTRIKALKCLIMKVLSSEERPYPETFINNMNHLTSVTGKHYNKYEQIVLGKL